MTGSFVVSPCFERAQLWGRTEINESGDLEEEFDRLLPGRRRRGSGVLIRRGRREWWRGASYGRRFQMRTRRPYHMLPAANGLLLYQTSPHAPVFLL